MEKILCSLPFLKHLKDEHLKTLCDNASLLNFDKDEVLYYEGEVVNKFYYILEGEIKFFKVNRFDNEIFLYYSKSDSMISDNIDIGKLCNKECFANTIFTKQSKIIAFNSDYFFNLIKNDIIISSKFHEDVSRRINLLQDIITRDVVFDGTAKVAFMIMHDLKRFNELKKSEIAYELHIQPETLSRILAKMVRNGLIKIDKSTVFILDKKALQEIYE